MPSDADAIISIYERHAKAYDRLRRRSLLERTWLDAFAELLPAGGSVLDLGCGMGEPIARYLIERDYAVTGIDSSADLIALCRDRFPEQTWLVADMRALSLHRAFDGVIAWDSFFHLTADHQRRMFAVFRDHAAPHAALVFTSGPARGEAIGEFQGEALYHASLDPAEYRALLDAHGFRLVRHLAEDKACGGHTVWLAQRM
ncbi:class I SAM-dependent methyltransferase [Pseudorhodoplanes sp.]|uniref:class I SAM-dependent DNA methyltransferase n=1 Tax=Pseudorhodoplanes sp. TaxID=1934341 RepID=UPI002C1E6E4D|nr:class I SAM-dependent methyltransferase [Pseudorhodoplanes sp.]HWV52844.1 class I SAM-dependent methyltransferase [Pseudorhodoplanes sp.]